MALLNAVFGGILSVFNFVVGGIVALAGVITTLFFQLAVSTLNAVTGSTFISLSYTNPTDNPFIAVGWELTRGLTNIIFVLALLAIGLGTALKMQDYQAKKALPLLIIIALLINFTPVILGVIVDASNIIMNYFLSSGFQGGNVLGTQLSNILSVWNPIGGNFDAAEQGSRFVALLIIVGFNIVAAFIFFIFAAIFLMRYVIIWLLVILSPIAFASYILPATRGLFKKWWAQFLQWTFVGVTAGFYLYLANQLINLIISEEAITFSVPGGEGLGLLDFILPWFVIIIFLLLGLQSALSSSAQGAKIAINAVNRGGGKIGNLAGKRALTLTREKMPAGVSKWAERQSMAANLGAGVRGPLGAIVRGLASPISTTRRWGGSMIKATLNEKQDADKAAEEAKKRDSISNLSLMRGTTTTKAQREGIIRTMIEKKQLRDVMSADIVGKENVLKDGELIGAYKKAVQFRDADTMEGIERATISSAVKDEKGEDKKDVAGNKVLLATEFAKIIQEATRGNLKEEDRADADGLVQLDRDRGYTKYAEKIVGEAKTADELKQLKKGWWAEKPLMEAAHKFWGGHQIGESARTFGRSFSDGFQSFAQDKGLDWYFEIDEIVDQKTGKKSYKTRNPDVPKYLTGTGALVLGMGIPGVSAGEVNQRTTASRILEKAPSLSGAYKQYRAVREMKQHIERERVKGVSQAAIDQAEQTLRQEEDSLKNNLNILYGANPALEKEWDKIEQTGRKKQGRGGGGGGQRPQPPTPPPAAGGPTRTTTPPRPPRGPAGQTPPRIPPQQTSGPITSGIPTPTGPLTPTQIKNQITALWKGLNNETNPKRIDTIKRHITKLQQDLANTQSG